MSTVQPFQKEDLKRITEYLKEKKYKYYLIFILAISTGLRISDVLKIKKNDINNYKCITIKEQKTGKIKRFPIREEIAKLLKEYQTDNETGYLFIGQKGSKLDRSSVYRVLNQAVKDLKIETKTGTHSMRKTFGRNLYEQTKDIGLLMEIFNHSSSKITLRYIGLTQEKINEAYNNLDLGIAI